MRTWLRSAAGSASPGGRKSCTGTPKPPWPPRALLSLLKEQPVEEGSWGLCYSPEEWFSKCSPLGPAAAMAPGNLSTMQILGPSPDPLSQKLWWGIWRRGCPAVPSDWRSQWLSGSSLRTTCLGEGRASACSTKLPAAALITDPIIDLGERVDAQAVPESLPSRAYSSSPFQRRVVGETPGQA